MLYRGRDKKDFYLASLLYDSIEFRHFESVKSLLTEKGADPNLVLSKKGISPFHLVIGCESHDFSLKVTSLILQNGGNPNVRSDEGLTPVHIAAAWGKVDILKLLLRNGGDPEAKDLNRKTPLHYAASENFTECLELLRAYVPETGSLLAQNDASDVNCLVLDKIVVNNGHVVGEYELEPVSTPISINLDDKNLHTLPETDATEYILNWFDQQQSVTSSTPTDSLERHFGSATSLDQSDNSVAESEGDRSSKRYDQQYITFRKVYTKTRKKSSPNQSPQKPKDCVHLDTTISNERPPNSYAFQYPNFELTQMEDYSKESGINTLPPTFRDTSVDSWNQHSEASKHFNISNNKNERSSDYLTCSQYSIDALEKNIFEITEDLSNLQVDAALPVEERPNSTNGSQELSFVSVSEVYKYIDQGEGVVLYEKRLLKTPSEYAKSVKSSNLSSLQSTLPEALDYDTDTLRRELTQLGYSAGPITLTTKRVYLKKLYQLKKHPPPATKELTSAVKKRVYSLELEKTLRNAEWRISLESYKTLEAQLSAQFSKPDPSRKWREGVNKSSFTYLLLDPRVTSNLPSRADNLPPEKIWETFLSAIFYVGKGKRSRPYQHLYDAVQLWKTQEPPSSKKLKKIVDVWNDGGGVICLHVFLNIIPVEAYTREAAMIGALGLENLTNAKGGEFYGVAATWMSRQKRMLGVYLLYRAMGIFLNEGERQLYPEDIN